ncbi:hypothetical protein K443DRAFT_443084 [Laccaria amethystina LaAM-08-1]|uniref:Unplaced genomic scaffold K443scaffold_39, whole genome shotgun sequence n=1 Tax=Laccaria amethystina LaAM-08-1 TaxID=1095629 RepID=A0A0C9Y1Y0_9AGAR|nr:hypothetical protein K443DRAFT_443084 [Laccaria amethystina LaAM-08-1]
MFVTSPRHRILKSSNQMLFTIRNHQARLKACDWKARRIIKELIQSVLFKWQHSHMSVVWRFMKRGRSRILYMLHGYGAESRFYVNIQS